MAICVLGGKEMNIRKSRSVGAKKMFAIGNFKFTLRKVSVSKLSRHVNVEIVGTAYIITVQSCEPLEFKKFK